MSISLTKGQAISLEKTSGPKLAQVTMGLGWDVKKSKGFFGLGGGGGSIDLDASCLMFDASNQMVDQVWFRQLQSNDGSIRHSGDNRTGAGDGDDETINVNLEKLPANVVTLIFTVNSFTGDTFDRVENAFCRLVDASNRTEIAKYNLSSSGNHTGQVMAKVSRKTGEWVMTALGENSSGRTFQEMGASITRHL
jgi:tellurium resistance protein TerZ